VELVVVVHGERVVGVLEVLELVDEYEGVVVVVVEVDELL